MPDAAPLHIVSGKGGTGKTTIALALALMLGRAGHKTLVCEVESRHGLSEAAGLPKIPDGQERTVAILGQSLRMLSVDSGHALRDYLDSHARLGVAGVILDKTGFVDFATELAPGLRDVLLTGKVYQAARRRLKGSPHAVDAIVMDAPPTGRIETFLTAGDALAEVMAVGPIAPQAQSIMELLRSRSTKVHLVTTLSEMAVIETLETIDALTSHGIAIGHVVVNQVAGEPPALPSTVTDGGLRSAWERDRAVAADQQPWAETLAHRLSELDRPPALTIDLLPDEVGPDDLGRIADVLAEGWAAA
jgi:anion-transporting  ArsA/GET3 family ATPase